MHTKKIECLDCQEDTAREKAQVIWELRHEYKIGLLIDIARIPRSTYYYYSKQFEKTKPDKYTEKKQKFAGYMTKAKDDTAIAELQKSLEKCILSITKRYSD